MHAYHVNWARLLGIGLFPGVLSLALNRICRDLPRGNIQCKSHSIV